MDSPEDLDDGPGLDGRLGFVRLPRGLRDHPVMRRPNALVLYIWILCRARHKAGVVTLARGMAELQPGQCTYGENEAAMALGMGRQEIRTAAQQLERLGLISRKATSSGTIVTARGFEEIRSEQPATQPTEQPATNQRPNQELTTKKTKRRRDEEKDQASGLPTGRVLPFEARQIAEGIAAHVLARDPGARNLQGERHTKTVDAWADDIRLLHERDGRSWADIAATWAWARHDAFWSGNVLSGTKLRHKFDTLRQQMARTPANGRRSPAGGSAAPEADLVPPSRRYSA